jgi:hypothetical protein
MEGYLSLLHKKKFTKFWFVLEGQQLTYYERLDLIQQLPVRVQVKMKCSIKVVGFPNFHVNFGISAGNDSPERCDH